MSTLITMKNGEKRSLRLWQGATVLSLVAIPFAYHHATTVAMGQLRFVMMDGAGTFYLSKLGTFKSAEQIHVEAAKTAAATLLTLKPSGLEYAETAERLFWKDAKAALDQSVSVNRAALQQRQIHQWIETTEVSQIVRNDTTFSVSVKGQLISRGLQGGQFVDTPKEFEVFFDFSRNSDMASNGMFPLVVTHYQVVRS
jgi:hypothetical protein